MCGVEPRRARLGPRWVDGLARRVFQAPDEVAVAQALVDATRTIASRGVAVYRERNGKWERIAGTGSGLALPDRANELDLDGQLVVKVGALCLVADTWPCAAPTDVAQALPVAVAIAAAASGGSSHRNELRDVLSSRTPPGNPKVRGVRGARSRAATRPH